MLNKKDWLIKLKFVLVLVIVLFVPLVLSQLEDYPDLFRDESGVFSAKIVVGENAAESDFMIAKEIAAGIHSGGETPDFGNAVKEIETSSNKLNFVEPLGRVIPTLTEDDLGILEGGDFVDRSDRIPYTQNLQLRDTTSNLNKSEYIVGLVTFDENRDNEVNMYLLFPDNILIFEYILNFVKGAESDVTDGRLVDFEDKSINILGGSTFIYKSIVDTSANSITLGFADVLAEDVLAVGEMGSYDINGEPYSVEVLEIYGDDNDSKVEFVINGERIDSVGDNERKKLGNGLNIIVRDVLLTGKDTSKDSVDFSIGSDDVVELVDSDYTDDTFEEKVSVDGDEIDGGEVLIRGYEDDEGFVLQEIRYRLRAESKDGGNVYIPPLGMLSEELESPEGVFGFDFLFLGPKEYETTNINFSEGGDESYDLSFTTNEDLRYTIPLADNSNDSGEGFKYGTDEDMLWFNEGKVGALVANYNFTIEEKDYFVLTNAPIKETSDTHVLRYESIDTGQKSIVFSDLAGDNISVNYHNSSKAGTEGEGTIKFTSGEYTFYISNESDRDIAVDMNTDGDVNEDEVQIVTKYGAVIDLGPDNFPDDSGGLDSFDINFTTLSSEFEGDGLLNLGTDEVSTFTVSEENDEDFVINLDVTQMSTVPGDMIDVDGMDIKIGGQIHGGAFVLTDHGEGAEELLIDYPDSQVALRTAVGQVDVLGAARQGILTFLQSAAVPIEPVLDSSVTEDDKDLILVGGPCVNSLAREVLGVSLENCADGFEAGSSVIRYIEHEGRRVILIAGHGAEDTVRAGKAFANLKELGAESEIIIK
jgi:hypothetical protein